jgi:hypothetical protein
MHGMKHNPTKMIRAARLSCDVLEVLQRDLITIQIFLANAPWLTVGSQRVSAQLELSESAS